MLGAFILLYHVRTLDTRALESIANQRRFKQPKLQTRVLLETFWDPNHNQLKTYYNLVKTEGIHEPFLVQVQDKARGKLHARKVK